MQHISMTPFGRQPVTAGLLASLARVNAPAPVASVDKWQLLRDLTTARKTFAVSDRDLAVLSALLSFHQDRCLTDDTRLVVFPSNATLSERAHGMAESTLRRHLAALVRAGLILRRDSPNGKRFSRRDMAGDSQAYGFDLRPLLVQAEAIADAARMARDSELRLKLLREQAVLLLRDAAKLIAWGQQGKPGCWDHETAEVMLAQRVLRRKLDADLLQRLVASTTALINSLRTRLLVEADKPDGNDSQNERHIQDSYSEESEPESCYEQGMTLPAPDLTLDLVLSATPEIQAYRQDEIRNWRDLTTLCDFLHPMLGIPERVWAEVCGVMGRESASVALACIMQRLSAIARPAGYLRHLADQAALGRFRPAAMVMALLRAEKPHMSQGLAS